MIRIAEVKQNENGRLGVKYSQTAKERGVDMDEFALCTSEQPVPELWECFEGILDHFLDMCDLPASYKLDKKTGNRLLMRKIVFTYEGPDEVMCVKLHTERQLKSSAKNLPIPSPKRPSHRFGSKSDEMFPLPEDCLNALLELQEHCREYINGKRAQRALPLDSETIDIEKDHEQQAREIFTETGRPSTSMLQRRMRIGYTVAARIMDRLEEAGIIGPPNGSEPREILIELDVEEPAA